MKQIKFLQLVLMLFALYGLNTNSAFGQSHWSSVSADCSFSITIVTEVSIDGVIQTPLTDDVIEIGAFHVGTDECRSSVFVWPPEMSGADTHVAFLNICGVPGDEFYYKIYHHGENREYEAVIPITTFTTDDEWFGMDKETGIVTPITTTVTTSEITIDTPPANIAVTFGNITESLTIEASAIDNNLSSVTPTYQWYSNTTESNTDGTLILSETGDSFDIPTDLTIGDHYYYCVVSAKNAVDAVSNVATVTVNAAPTGIAINETNFPDDNFRNYLAGQSYGTDLLLTDDEILAITDLNLDGMSIADLTGIGFFTALEQLNCGNNSLTLLPELPASLKTLVCNANLLTSLPTLPTSLETLNCINNSLSSLPALPASLTWLECQFNSLASLPALPSSLTVLDCSYNQLASLDLSGLTSLGHFSGTNQAVPLTLTGNSTDGYTLPITLNAPTFGNATVSYSDGTLTSTDNAVLSTSFEVQTGKTDKTLSGTLTLAYNTVASLPPLVATATTTATGSFAFGISALAANTDIYVDWGDGTPVAEGTVGTTTRYISGTLAGNTFQIYGMGISSLSFGSCSDIDISKATDLTGLICNHNQLTTLDVSNNTALEYLSCYDNQLMTLDVSNNTALEYLSCYNNQLTTLNVSNNTALKSLNCNSNQLTTLDVSSNLSLEALDCHSNQLTALDLTQNAALTYLAAMYNQLTELNLAPAAVFTHMYVWRNQLKFSTLPLSSIAATYDYYPQDTIQGGTLPLAGGVDLSSEAVIDGTNTAYNWFEVTSSVETAISTGITESPAGKFTFAASLAGKTLRCKMTNTKLPALTLVYDVTLSAASGVAPTITTNELIFIKGEAADNQKFEATGDAPITWTITFGSLPTGLSLNAATGEVTGTPTVAGSNSINVTAENGAGSVTKSMAVVVYIRGVPTVTMEKHHDVYAGTITAGENTVHYLYMNPSMEVGHLSYSDLHADLEPEYAALLQETSQPEPNYVVYNAGSGNTVADAAEVATVDWTDIEAVAQHFFPGINTIDIQYGTPVNEMAAIHEYDFSYTQTGYTTYEYFLSEELQVVYMYIDGAYTQTLITNKHHNIIDARAGVLTGTFSPIITTATLPDGTVGTAYSETLAANSNTSVAWTIEGVGALPDGLLLDGTTGEISGTPTADGTFNFTVKATNAAGDDTETLSIVINPATPPAVAPVITTANLSGGTVGTTYSRTLAATGTVPITWTIDNGSLPKGLTLNASTGAITGTPVKSGKSSFTVKATNSAGNDTKALSIVISPATPPAVAPTITTTTLSGGTVGDAYNQTLAASGTAFITWSIENGNLPDGLTLDGSTGEIFGMPTTDGTFNFTVKATNTAGDDTQALSILINPIPVVLPDIVSVTILAGLYPNQGEYTLEQIRALFPATVSVTLDNSAVISAAVVWSSNSNPVYNKDVPDKYTFTGTIFGTEEYSNNNNWTASIDVWVERTTGIVNPETADVRLYPNPVADILNVDNKQTIIQTIRIHDASGRTVSVVEPKSTSWQFVTSAWQSGLYIVSVETDAGTSRYKVIKK